LKKIHALLFLFLWLVPALFSQQEEDWNIDSIFDKAPEENEEETDENDLRIIEELSRSRLTMGASYTFLAGYSPGWAETPWYREDRNSFYDASKLKHTNYELGAKMEALLSLDFQIAENLRIWNSFYFSIPPSNGTEVISLNEFYFDYNLSRIVFLRAGQFELAWGISPFYPFTNLPARIPSDYSGGDAYIVKVEIPIGIGGLQVLGMTRSGFMSGSKPTFDEIAYGVKYNLAFPIMDINTGFFYFKEMPLRFFGSLKTTLGNTEAYTEGVITISRETREEPLFSGNFGLARDFFLGKLTMSGEVFYNGEKNGSWWRPKDEIREAEYSPLYEGWNGAFAFIVRPGVIGLRFFSQILYSFKEDSALLIPGISIRPGNLVTVTLSVPMALGSRKGYYVNNIVDTADPKRPFCIILGITFKGDFRYSIYMDRSD
jgi:hypothetical protein